MTRRLATVIAGVSIVLVTNAIALAGVAYNRSVEPDAVVEFSGRELRMPYYSRSSEENTGLGLRIACRFDNGQPYGFARTSCNGQPVWLDQEKLVEIGFDLAEQADVTGELLRSKYDLPRKIYLVLEYNGAAYRERLTIAAKELSKEQAMLADNPGSKRLAERVESARKRLDDEKHRNSRLFAIDAGHEKARLRAAFADGSRYIIMQSRIRVVRDEVNGRWKGHLGGLLIKSINIPLRHRAAFEGFERNSTAIERSRSIPSYKVRVAFGQRAEPWVVSVTR